MKTVRIFEVARLDTVSGFCLVTGLMFTRFSFITLVVAAAAHAEVKLPTIISNHMVLQQKQENPIWGWDAPETKVTVTFAGQTQSAVAGSDGKWLVKLAPLPANATPQVLTVSGSTKCEVNDVLVGEVWMCSGQSNMGFALRADWNGDLEAEASRLPLLRLINVPEKGTQKLETHFEGEWKASTPETALSFSAVGFLFARYVHQTLQVPVGVIDTSWGGAPAEAFVRRSTLDADARFKSIKESAETMEAKLLPDNGEADFAKATAAFEKAKAAKNAGARPPRRWLEERSRPGNIFGGMIHPVVGYGMKGVIWYQGEANAGRAWEYAALFPFLITEWRREWQQGDFPFYWVQLADFMAEDPTQTDSGWAELRESQSKTLALPNTGQAVIIDLGEGKDIHPRNKHDVAARLARWALAKDYGLKFPYRSPEFKSVAFAGAKATITLDCFGSRLRAFDVEEPRGFIICGADKVWHPAKGKIVGTNTVELTSEHVAEPIAVRYAWANNPVCNLYSNDGLPVTPFRTDDFEMTTKPK